jgi:DeoR/GlpR family transcriptional regulator of sugar metabolism
MDVPEKRRQEIKKILFENKSMSIKNLSKLLNISEITIRRDLVKLEIEGFVDKVHGGAMARGFNVEYNPVYMEDIMLNREQKERIAKEAVKLINDGDGVIIESGTTCLELVYNLADKKNLTIFTTSIPTAYELWKLTLNRNDLELNICGGRVETKSNSLIGSPAVNYFQNINADIAFIGAPAILVDKGIIATNNQLDAEVMRSIINNSKKKILIGDNSKFSKNAFISIMPLTEFDEIITDSGIDNDTSLKIQKLGIKLKIV